MTQSLDAPLPSPTDARLVAKVLATRDQISPCGFAHWPTDRDLGTARDAGNARRSEQLRLERAGRHADAAQIGRDLVRCAACGSWYAESDTDAIEGVDLCRWCGEDCVSEAADGIDAAEPRVTHAFRVALRDILTERGAACEAVTCACGDLVAHCESGCLDGAVTDHDRSRESEAPVSR